MVITKPAKSITKITIDTTSTTLLLISDVHFDSVSCERKLLKENLDLAKKKKAIILFNGDFFDMMQSRNDKRGTKSSLRKEYLGENYFDLVIQDAFDFLQPYAANIAIMADGNHETAITKNYETNPLDRLCYMLKKEANSNVVHTGYQSWVLFNIALDSTNTSRIAYKIKLHHGSGGNARVTKGVIEHNRISTYVNGADMVWLGHTHTQYYMHNTVESLFTKNGAYQIKLDKVHQIRTGCWKQEYKEGGWSVEKGFGPSEIGGYWVELQAERPEVDGKRVSQIKTRIYPT